MDNKNYEMSEFGTRMSVEEFLKATKCKGLDVAERANKPGYYYFWTENTVGYVPKSLGDKIKNGEKYGTLFITQVTTEGHAEPMWILCERKTEGILHIPALD